MHPVGETPIEELDLSLQIHPAIAPILSASDWQGTRATARNSRAEFATSGFQADGLLVKAGPTWFERLETLDEAG
jgi:hypothetical protein